MWDHFKGRKAYEVIERNDGYIDTSKVAPELYFAPFRDWPAIERRAIQYARGRVLDVGCGAGRVSIYLQNRRNLDVLGMDNSPLAIRVSKARGLRKASLVAFQDINFPANSFDTVVMFGNNFGLFGSRSRARRLLRRLNRMTSADALLLAESNNPYRTDQPEHLRYHQLNRQKGRMSGQVRIRVRFRRYVGSWFDYLLVSPEEMKDIAKDTGWAVDRFVRSRGSSLYVGVLRKTPSR
jgi:cyclopropane fatty-acyl-phospholipid synthase-like methyltransferase